MVDEVTLFTRGGVYLARLDPAKHAEVGKIRPVILLMAQEILNVMPLSVFVCPLSSHSAPAFNSLHIELSARDSLQVTSYALVEHCRSISIKRLIHPRLAQLTVDEIELVLHRLQRLVGL